MRLASLLAGSIATVTVMGCAAAEVDDSIARCANGRCADAARGDGSADDDASFEDASIEDTSLEDASLDRDAGTALDARSDAGAIDASTSDSPARLDTASGPDTAVSIDSARPDTAVAIDTSTGPITGGPCASGAPGATAFRIRWTNSGGTATVSYEVTGLPDRSGFKVAAYSTSFGYTPAYSDMFLAVGGLDLSGTQFVDVDLSTIGLTSIRSATLSLYGRSFATGSSGSFTWNTFDGAGSSGSISNAAPYHWDSTNVTSGLGPGKVHKLRIKPGPPSGALVISRIELCIET